MGLSPWSDYNYFLLIYVETYVFFVWRCDGVPAAKAFACCVIFLGISKGVFLIHYMVVRRGAESNNICVLHVFCSWFMYRRICRLLNKGEQGVTVFLYCISSVVYVKA